MKTSIATICALYFVIVMAAVFYNSLPNFCANPNGNGNWIVQPICK